jgi:hypothetical protein
VPILSTWLNGPERLPVYLRLVGTLEEGEGVSLYDDQQIN